MNKNLSTLAAQLKGIWGQLAAGQKVSVVLATLVLMGGVGALAFWSSSTQYSLLYGRLADSEAAKVIAALDDAKVAYKVTGGGGTIMVPTDKVHLMRMQLAGRGIPKGEGVGFEIFDKPNFGISDFVQRANYVRAVQGELGRTISQLNEIEAARVMIVLPENRLLLDKDKHATASVFVRVQGNSQLPPQAVNSIQFLVANAVEGLKPNNVAVIDNLGNVLSANMENDSVAGMSGNQLASRRNLEQYLSKKGQELLEKVLGPGQAIVKVSAEINYDTITRMEEKFDPDGTVLRLQTKNDENMESLVGSTSTPVGITANIVPDTNAHSSADSPVNNTQSRKALTTMQYEVSRTTSNTSQAAGGLKRISAAVTVAARMEGTGAARKMAPRTEDELNKLRRVVSGALGIQTNRDDVITLEELPFNDEFTAEVTRELGDQRRQEFWWNIGRDVAYGALALGALFVLARMFKRAAMPNDLAGLGLGHVYRNGNGHGNGHNGNGAPAHIHARGNGVDPAGREFARDVITIEALNQLIKENPANMTNAIREWMARGRTS